jgi:membrane protease YdiL (CAAX protease family)
MNTNDSFEQIPTQPAEEPRSLNEIDPVGCLDAIEPTRSLSPDGWDGDPVRADDAEAQPAPLFPDPFTPAAPAPERLLFQSYTQPVVRPPARIPHLGHVCLLFVLALFGLMGTSLLTWGALHYHFYGVSTLQGATTEIHYTIGSMAALYLLTFAACLFVFPLVWRKSFLAGLHWNAATAVRLRWRLIGAACLCFLLAMADEALLPGPTNAPIDKLFQTPGAAWLMFAFGVTCAPFFEEMAFRGFLLPAFATAWDWSVERSTGKPALPLDECGNPQWSMFAMVAASILTSVPFALMHGDQTAYSLGTFLLLVVVSLVLCTVRLLTRSLAASVLVHACYNFLLFSLMLLGTSGFRHLNKV